MEEKAAQLALLGCALTGTPIEVKVGDITIIEAKIGEKTSVESATFLDSEDALQIVCEIVRVLAPEDHKEKVIKMFMGLEKEQKQEEKHHG